MLLAELKDDVEAYLHYTIFPTYYGNVTVEFKELIVSDVVACSAFDEGYYAMSDIHIAFERAIMNLLKVDI